MILKPSPVPPVPREGSVYLDLPGLVPFEFGGYHVSIKSALDFLVTWIFLQSDFSCSRVPGSYLSSYSQPDPQSVVLEGLRDPEQGPCPAV